MVRPIRSIHVLALVLALVPFAFRPARALPLFARQYSMPCTQCHVAFPRLNDFGMKFLRSGYILEGSEGQSPWESQNFPFSIVGNVGMDLSSADAREDGDRTRSTLTQFRQNWVEFHAAGTLAKKISYHFDSGFEEDVNGTNALQSGQAFVQFDELAKGGALNLKVGVFDAEVPYLASSRRTMQADYMAPVTLDGEGFEFNGERQGWAYALGLINSQREHGAPSDHTLNRLEDPYLWVMGNFQGQRVAARVLADRQNPRKPAGSASLRLQVDASACFTYRKLMVIPAYIFERFDDPDAETPNRIDHGLLEALLPLDKESRWVLTGRYELQHTPKTDLIAESDLWLGALDLGCYVNPNAKVGVDWAHLGNNTGEPYVDELQAYIHIGF